MNEGTRLFLQQELARLELHMNRAYTEAKVAQNKAEKAWARYRKMQDDRDAIEESLENENVHRDI